MFAIAVLVPGLLLGVIAWGVVGVLRQRGREEFTQATAAALYARAMVVATMLAGIGLLAAGGHAVLGRFVAGLRSGSPAWIVRGTPIVLIVLTGLAASWA